MECDRIAREAKISAENCHSLQKDLAATADVGIIYLFIYTWDTYS